MCPMIPMLRPWRVLLIAVVLLTCASTSSSATDYFLTIGGGYNPMGNQASLEANILFFQQVLRERHGEPRSHDIFFADGNDEQPDLQVLAAKKPKEDLPATELLAAIHRRREPERLEYRNHRVPQINGPLDPAMIHASLTKIAKSTRDGDRVIIYVTAHGSVGPENNPYNTTIDCWDEKKITAREFTRWLSELPATIPVVMVTAQCYCGGFSHTIFEDLDQTKGLAPQLRAGFFAQQHDLPAAGCRPDIEHDEEFSSYFWGAIAGRSRTGVPIANCDVNGDGIISFAEAYAYAVIAGETIDIPLRTSDTLLRTYSRMSVTADESAPPASESSETADGEGSPRAQTQTSRLAGSLQDFLDLGRPVSDRIVIGLGRGLGFTLDSDAADVVAAYNKHRRGTRNQSRGQRRRPGGGRRELLQEVAKKWPELGDERHWEESPLLKAENQEQLLKELQELPSWKAFDQRRRQMAEATEQAAQHELREVKFRRLINTLESIVLEQNLPKVAKPEIVSHYHRLISLEESALSDRKQK